MTLNSGEEIILEFQSDKLFPSRLDRYHIYIYDDIIMRILIDVPKNTVAKLQKLAKRQNSSRAELVRQAVDRYLEAHQEQFDESAAFGIWKTKKQDALVIEDKLRSEWGAHERRPRHKHSD